MKDLAIILFSLIFLISCETEQTSNVYSPPQIDKEAIENYFYYSDAESLEIIKSKIKIALSIDNNNLKIIKPENISNFIDCGFMNDEIYVDYINRIFNSSLVVKIIFKDDKLDDRNVINIYFDYIFKSKETGTTWRFSSNKAKDLLVGNPVYDDNPYRKCISKQKLESELSFVLL